MRIKKTVPDHEIEIPDRIEIGEKYWYEQVVKGKVDPKIYHQISSEKRLQDEEKSYILDKKLSDAKIIKVEDLKDMWKKIEVWVLGQIVGKLLTPGAVEKYLTIIFKFLISFVGKGIAMLKIAASKTETKIDDQVINAISNGFDHLVGEKEKEVD